MSRSSSNVPASETPTPVRKKSQKITVALSERTAFSVVEAGALIGIGPSKAYEMAASGQIPTIKVGQLRRVPGDQFRRKFGLGEAG